MNIIEKICSYAREEYGDGISEQFVRKAGESVPNSEEEAWKILDKIIGSYGSRYSIPPATNSVLSARDIQFLLAT